MQNDEQHRKYNISSVTSDSSSTDTPHAIKVDWTKEQRPFSRAFSPSLSPFSHTSSAGLVLDRFLRNSCHNDHDNRNAGSPPESYEIRWVYAAYNFLKKNHLLEIILLIRHDLQLHQWGRRQSEHQAVNLFTTCVHWNWRHIIKIKIKCMSS